jgi:predicted DNA-binding transcriptional regulator
MDALLIKIVDLLVERPVLTIPYVGRHFNVTYVTARNNVAKLTKAGILKEIVGSRRCKVYLAEEVFEIINRPFSLG